MWLFKNIRDWKRKDFDPPLDNAKQIRRNKAKKDSDHDLQKPLQQFLCDVHEEANRPPCKKSDNAQLTYAEDRILDAIDKLSCENKRMVALQTVTAYESSRMAKWITFLSFLILILTIVLVVDVFSKYISDSTGTHWKSTRPEKSPYTINEKINSHQKYSQTYKTKK